MTLWTLENSGVLTAPLPPPQLSLCPPSAPRWVWFSVGLRQRLLPSCFPLSVSEPWGHVNHVKHSSAALSRLIRAFSPPTYPSVQAPPVHAAGCKRAVLSGAPLGWGWGVGHSSEPFPTLLIFTRHSPQQFFPSLNLGFICVCTWLRVTDAPVKLGFLRICPLSLA